MSIYFVRPLTVLFHELGHAIPALLFTRSHTRVFVGSYGETKGSIRIKIGMLEMFLAYNPLGWSKGVCIAGSGKLSINQQVIFTLAGPAASLIIATTAIAASTFPEGYSYVQFFLYLFFASAVFDFLNNLTPKSTPITLANGSKTYNDGKQLQLLFRLRKATPLLKEANELYNAKKYNEARLLYQKILCEHQVHTGVLLVWLYSCLVVGAGDEVRKLITRFHTEGNMSATDMVHAGGIMAMLGNDAQGEVFFKQALELEPENVWALASCAYMALHKGEYQSAIHQFDKVIGMDEKFAYAYGNRGLTKIRCGDVQQGLEDIQHALSLNPDEPYALRNLGIYHLDRRERDSALEYLQKAKLSNHHTHLVDELIRKAEMLPKAV